MTSTDPPILSVENIEVVYDHAILALRGVSLGVAAGRIVALLGANGAGKTTTLKAISKLIGAERGAIVAGDIQFQGVSILDRPPDQLVRAGLVQVLEGRHCFARLSVEENLLTGAFVRKPGRAALKSELERVYAYFPRLKVRRKSLAGLTSGGEQQMVAIGRALMAHPRLLLLDEPSMGLAPQVVDEIFHIVTELNRREGVAVLLAEQNATLALKHAHHGYILENGRVALAGSAEELRGRDDVKHFYLGMAGEERRSFKSGPGTGQRLAGDISG